MTFTGPLGLLQLSWDRRIDLKAAPEARCLVSLLDEAANSDNYLIEQADLAFDSGEAF